MEDKNKLQEEIMKADNKNVEKMWKDIDENCTLKTFLEKMTKDELVKIAKRYSVRGITTLKKADAVERVMNVILLGTVVKMMNLEDIDWEEIIRNNVKEKFIDVNIKAFNEGIKLIDKREGDIYAL